MEEERLRVVVELHEVGGRRMSGVGREEVAGLVVCVAPHEDVADGPFRPPSSERVCLFVIPFANTRKIG